MNPEYNLTVIEEEKVALAPHIAESGFFMYAVTGLLLVLVALLVAVYIRICKQYQRRIAMLCSEGKAVPGASSYSIYKLKRIVEQKEIEVAETMIE